MQSYLMLAILSGSMRIERVIFFYIGLLFLASPVFSFHLITSSDIISTEPAGKGKYSEHRVLDHGSRYSDEAMGASTKQFLSYANYTLNQITPGYKRNNFANYLNGDHLESKEYIIAGVGPQIETQSPFDVIINGDGYFYVETTAGPAFTSDGRFDLDKEGYLCILGENRFRVRGKEGFIHLKTRNISVLPDGAVYDGGELVGQLEIVRPSSFDKATSLNNAYFIIDPENLEILEPSQYQILQGYYEASSVPKSLGVGDAGRYTYMYFINTYMMKKTLKTTRTSIQMGN